MSRIDEALRRAAEERTADPGGVDRARTPQPPEGDRVSAFSREPFPIEIASRRREPPPVPAPVPDKGPTGRDARDTGAHDPSATPASLFERLHASLTEKVVVDARMSPVSREQYRRLAAVLHDAQGHSDLRVVMVASALPGEGKTLTAANLALTLSESYRRRVLLIDADLRKPALHQLFRLNTAGGLIDGLDSPNEVKLVLRQVSPQLWVLPAGRPTADPMAGLTSERMRRVIKEARESFDWIIIDTPPLLALADAHLLSSLVDRAVLVVRANSTPHEMVKRASELIGANRVIGVVLNRAEVTTHDTYANYYGQHMIAGQGQPS
ncbi:MAG TPA: CpsD/CapB family tyrosine-protein kinase [Vicinamibacterales bacterium]|nr:CpsD/CapB family tyrosine-protein kinase [Vicinamibacterales bacterium]